MAQTRTNRLPAPAKVRLGLLGQAVGVPTLLFGMHAADLTAFLAGGVLAGVGAGVLLKAAIGTVAAMAAPARRGEALAGMFLISYLGLSLPAVGIGIATRTVSTVTAMTWFTGLLLVMLTGVAVLFRRSTGTRRAPARRRA
ncbi:hypothetical protein [Micromonospora zamorensis]|uniref:hypothetical protein n=1 Tax=Micromonospora zamorensis TaxID=709883 RepID=UPI0033B03C06